MIDDDYGLKKAVDSLIMISVRWQERNEKQWCPGGAPEAVEEK